MNAPYIPSQSLLQGKPYTPADKTDIRITFLRVLHQQAQQRIQQEQTK